MKATRPLILSASLLLLLLPGCSLLKAPKQVVSAVVPGSGSKQRDPADLQLQLQRFTDDFLARGTAALEEYGRRVGTQAAKAEAMRLQLMEASSLIAIATGPNPNANLLDLVAVTVLTRMTVEDYWVKTASGAAFQPWLETSRSMETNIWMLASSVLPPAQVEELRQGISQWYAANPEVRTAFFARPQQFSSMVRTTRADGADLASVFNWANLDPTSGLDPAVREVTRTRLFAERAMFVFQRMPFLLTRHAELLALDLAEQPAVQLALTNTSKLSDSADRLSRATEEISGAVARLPDQVSAERKAILGALEQQESKLKDLVTQVNQALESGQKMSTSLNTTLGTFDALMKRFGVGEPSASKARGTNSPPFKILDYGETAVRVGDMAREVNALVSNVQAATPQVEQLSKTAAVELRQAVDHGFRRGLMLIGVLLLGAVLAGLLYRFLASKVSRG